MSFTMSKIGGWKNMRSVAFSLLIVAFLVLVAAQALAVPVTIERVEVNDEDVRTTDTNRLDLVRGEDIDVKVRLNATGNGSDVEVEAFISGFEFNREMPISDSTPVFDVEAGVTYIKRLKLRVPDIAQEDNYLLRILVTDRNTQELVQSYRLKIDVPRHTLAIRDIVTNPDGFIVAGRALLVTVRVKNMGEQDEEGIKVRVSIPDLGVSATDYIDELEDGESTSTEELYLRIPPCAKPGDYDLRAVVEFNEGFDKVSSAKSIEVLASDTAVCEALGLKEKTSIMVSGEAQTVSTGGAGVVYPITVFNPGTSSKTFGFTAEGVEGWAAVRFSPSNVVMVGPGEVKTVNLFLTATPGAAKGERTFTVTVKDQAGSVVEQLVMRANVDGTAAAAAAGAPTDLRRYLEIGLVLLVVVLIILALVVLFSRMRGKEEEEGEGEAKTYY